MSVKLVDSISICPFPVNNSENLNWKTYSNTIFFSNSNDMNVLPNSSIHLIITSPPYFNIKDYSKNGYQNKKISYSANGQIGDICEYSKYLNEMLKVWKECERVLMPNGKLIINTPLMPMLKKEYTSHKMRHIFDINADIENSILKNTKMFLLDLYIWNRTNATKNAMFGSYPYPRNFYVQNTSEFVTVFVKDGDSQNNIPKKQKEMSKLTQKEWLEYTKQIWNIPIPNKKDLAFGHHSAIMPEQIVERCIRLYSYVGDIILDPFTGSGTTQKVAKQLNRHFVGYEISKTYKDIIEKKLLQAGQKKLF